MKKKFRLAVSLPLLASAIVFSVTLAAGGAAVTLAWRYLSGVQLAALSAEVREHADSVSVFLGEAAALLRADADMARQALQNPGAPMMGLEALRTHALGILAADTVFEYLELISPEGRILVAEPAEKSPSTMGTYVGDRAWLDETLRHPGITVSDLNNSRFSGHKVVHVAMPIFQDEGRLLGVWAGALDAESFSRIGGSFETGTRRGEHSYITDSTGAVVAHQSGEVADFCDYSSVPGVKAALDGNNGALLGFNPIEKTHELSGYTPVVIKTAAGAKNWAAVYDLPAQEAFNPIWAMSEGIAGFALILGLILASSTALVIRKRVKPIEILAAGARRIGAGELSARIRLETDDEFQVLGDAFNQMCDQLQARSLALETTNKELASFSYSVSHDLRTPLRAIDGFSEALLRKCAGLVGDDGKKYLNFIREATKRMAQLIDDLLKLSRLSREEMIKERLDISELARQSAAEISLHNGNRAVELVIPESLPAFGDRRLVQSVIQNLLENAWKFTRTKEHARIEVGSRAVNGETAFFVSDNGVGFEMEYVGKLFAPFQRLHRSDEFEGSGIGLATIQRIVHRHGGRVWAEAQVGNGATFYFTLGEADT